MRSVFFAVCASPAAGAQSSKAAAAITARRLTISGTGMGWLLWNEAGQVAQLFGEAKQCRLILRLYALLSAEQRHFAAHGRVDKAHRGGQQGHVAPGAWLASARTWWCASGAGLVTHTL